MNQKPLNGQVALITGGGTGIGKAFTEALLENGIGAVVIASRRKEIVDATATELNQKFKDQRVFPYSFDIRSRADTENLVNYVYKTLGSIDILINNSGLAVPETVENITDAGWEKVFETNLRGAMWLTRFVLPKMIEQDFGDIVNISSQAGKNGYADVPSYCASKFGLLGFAESVRDDVKKRNANLRIFNFCPGLVDVESGANVEVKQGFIGVKNMAKTLIYSLSLDRNVILEDINLYSR
jgi:3-oxoacyl-[acyl-carrier protein] reductase